LVIKANRVSESAKAAIEKAGGKLELIADKEIKVPSRGQGVRPRLARERQARRAAKQAKA
jgi:hypothetical protein